MSAVLHSFPESLARSHELASARWWELLYRQAFPGFASMVTITNDGWAQRGGVDRVITLKSGRTIRVEEKVRERDWQDVLLERWSNEQKRKPGWVQQDLAADYLAYIFLPSKTCLLIPFLDLRRAWRQHGKRWIAQYPEVRAQNDGYVTLSVAVPVEELLSALRNNMRIKWE